MVVVADLHRPLPHVVGGVHLEGADHHGVETVQGGRLHLKMPCFHQQARLELEMNLREV